jgi:hypothetical protein
MQLKQSPRIEMLDDLVLGRFKKFNVRLSGMHRDTQPSVEIT